MKKTITFGALLLMAGSLLAADSSKSDVSAAAQKLADSNYSWKSTQDMGANSQFTPGPTEGKTDKTYTWMSSSFGDNASIGLIKGTNCAIKTEEGWKSAADLGDAAGGFDPNTFMLRRLQGLKAPAAELEEIIAKTDDLKKDGDMVTGTMSEEGAKAMLNTGMGRRGGGPGGPGGPGGARPEPTDAKCTVKIWLKDGAIAKYETKVTGKMSFNGEARDIERTTTVEIKDVGKTTIEVPDDAKKKLS